MLLLRQESSRSDMSAACMKLIFSGKVLKDDDTLEKCNIKENDFLVVMVTKPKKVPAPTPAPAPAPVASTPAPAVSGNTESAAASTNEVTATTATTGTVTTPAPAAPASASAPTDEFPSEVVSSLTSMGFPEDMVLACLRAAHGNPDIAVEFLTNGIPDHVTQATISTSSGTTTTPGTPSSANDPLSALRSHPQLNQLRRLVQTNPQALQAVLTQIGQQQPELLQAINSNQAAFIELMNEPIDESTFLAPSSATPTSAGAGIGSSDTGMGGIMPNPGDMARMLAGLSETELNEMATMMGLTPQQLRATAQAIGNMPPEQFQQHMVQAMGGGAGAGAGGMGSSPGQQVIRLNDEEMAAVNRLTELGFDRSEAVQAFLACDKNEALAANLLMDSMGDDGFGGAGFGGNNAGDDDDMYD